MNLKQKYNLVSKKGFYTRMKCFSIDLDGTLLNSSHQIPEENFKVLQDLRAQGHTIIINIGGAVQDVIKFEEIQKLQAPIISINGTVIYSSTQEVLYEASLPVETYKEILPILQDIGLWVMVYTNQGGFPCRNPEIQDKTDDAIEPIFANYDYNQILEKRISKSIKSWPYLVMMNSTKLTVQNKQSMEVLNFSWASSHPNNVEFTSVEANKGRALLRYQKLTDIQFDEIFAFGDGGNDLEQFKVAITSVAMENAPFTIKQEADVVTMTNDENGFAYAVQHLINL